jgi:DUF438 domain-containing protein
MVKLKQTVAGHLLKAFDSENRRIEAQKTYESILNTLTKTIFEASPKIQDGEESIFEEEQDLVAYLV